MQRPFLIVALTLASTALAQRPLPGLPMTPPPTPHPALVGQPLIGPTGGMTGGETRGQSGGQPAGQPAGCPAPKRVIDPDTVGVKLEGKALAAAVKRLAALPWFDDLEDARVESAATGKPIFWIQALGDIDGFA